MSSEVREILDRIQRLPAEQQDELLSELDRLEEEEWRKVIGPAREEARRRGIDDEAIARAVESLRYGRDHRKS